MTDLMELAGKLCCDHCGALFQGSYKQAWRHSRQASNVYCSPVCRFSAVGKKLRIIRMWGPCPTCGKTFESKAEKIFCSMRCYVKSPQFKEMTALNIKSVNAEKRRLAADGMRNGGMAPCLECGVEIYIKGSLMGKKKFCSQVCYRSYMAKRFDRWIANPQSMALPQGYDEFLDRQELACLIEGCDWRGVHLTIHMNQAHGVPKREFKRAAGFNLKTGVIAKPLAEVFQQRPKRGVALDILNSTDKTSKREDVIAYHSLEAKEHQLKSRMLEHPGPIRICIGCKREFQQSTRFGRAKYCSIDCRDRSYWASKRMSSRTTA